MFTDLWSTRRLFKNQKSIIKMFIQQCYPKIQHKNRMLYFPLSLASQAQNLLPLPPSSSLVPTFNQPQAAFSLIRILASNRCPGHGHGGRSTSPATPGPSQSCGHTTTKSPSWSGAPFIVLVFNEWIKTKLISWHSRIWFLPACPSTLATIPSWASSLVPSVYWLPECTPSDPGLIPLSRPNDPCPSLRKPPPQLTR